MIGKLKLSVRVDLEQLLGLRALSELRGGRFRYSDVDLIFTLNSCAVTAVVGNINKPTAIGQLRLSKVLRFQAKGADDPRCFASRRGSPAAARSGVHRKVIRPSP